jgi:hypothetical protein
MVGSICRRVAVTAMGPIQVNMPKPVEESRFRPRVSEADITPVT